MHRGRGEIQKELVCLWFPVSAKHMDSSDIHFEGDKKALSFY